MTFIVIPDARQRDPESSEAGGFGWIPGSLALQAPRNDRSDHSAGLVQLATVTAPFITDQRFSVLVLGTSR